MKVLAIDTALFGCAVGVYDPELGICHVDQKAMPRGQAEALVPMVQGVVEAAGASFDDIGLIVTTIGPGAFTGLRIGLSTAQGLALALACPVEGLTTLEALKAQFLREHDLPTDQTLCVLIETKRQDFYCQLFDRRGNAVSEPQALSLAKIEALLENKTPVLIGDACERFTTEAEGTYVVQEGYKLIDPEILAKLGYEKHSKGEGRKAKPLYLRDADVSVSKKEQRVILDRK